MTKQTRYSRMFASVLFALIGLLVIIAAPHSVVAQVTKGSISGTVTDTMQAVVVDAQIKLTNSDTGLLLTTTSDKQGYFRINLIPVGSYKLEIAKNGFKSTVLGKVQVTTGADSGLGQVALEVAGAQTTVEVVEASTPLIETSQAQVTTSFETQSLQELPSISDNQGLDNLALLVAGVSNARDNGMSNSNGANFNVNGIRSRNNDQQVDGQNNNDNSVGGPAVSVSNSEFVSEYQIVTNNFGPEYGRNSGSVVNVVTKSGTNRVHGSIFGNDTPSNLSTLTNIQKRFDGLTKVPRSNVEFGGFTLGGPIVKNKLFFFEGFDQSIGHWNENYSSTSMTPSPKGLVQLGSCANVNADALAALQKYSAFSITAGNPTATNATNKVVPIGSANCTVEFAGVTRAVPERQHQFNWLNKVDYTSGKNTVTARYLLSRNNVFNAASNGAAGWFYNVPSLSQQTKFGWTRQITDKIVNEVAVSFSRTNVSFGGGETNTIPAPSQMDQAVAAISITRVLGSTGTSGLGFGGGNTLPQARVVNTWQFQDNFNYQLGAHRLKAGLNWTYQRSPNKFLPNLNGSYSFNNFSTYLTNAPKSISIANGKTSLDFREYDTFMYAGDDWKVSPTLTVNLGLTYSIYGQPANLFHENDVKIQTSSTPLWNPALDQSITTFPTLPSNLSDVAPSAGFAWSPQFLGKGQRTVIRGGYRLSFDPPFYNIYLNIASSAPQVLAQTLTSGISGKLPANPTGPNVRSALASVLTLGVADPRNYSQTNLTNDFRSDRVQSWTLGIQRELGKLGVVEARYVGNHGDRLFQSINGNPKLDGLKARFPGAVPSSITLQSNGRPLVNSLVRQRTNTGYSDYNGLQTEFRADNLFHQLLIRTNYTWSKTTDNASEIFGTFGGGGTIAFAQNPLDYTKGEHALSGLDTPQSWTLSFVEKIPGFKSQKGVVGHVLGGWGISGTYMLASGQPYTPFQYYFNYMTSLYGGYAQMEDYSFGSGFSGGIYDGGLRPFVGNRNAPEASVGVYAEDACNYFGGNDECNMAGNQLLDFTSLNTGNGAKTVTTDKVRYIANGAAAQKFKGTPWGDAPRNMSRDFWTNTGNATITKELKIREGMNLQLRASFMNVFNHPNYGSVDPMIEDAGDDGYSNGPDGFGDPKLSDGGKRTILIGGTFRW